MDCIKYKKSGKILIKPKNKDELPLFKHCSGGSVAVTKKVFDKEVMPLLFKHGVYGVYVSDET